SCQVALREELTAQHPRLAQALVLYPWALGNQSGPAEFVVSKDDLAYSGLRERHYNRRTRLERIPIEVRRFDELFLGLPSLRDIKMEGEGGKYHILRGAIDCLRKSRPVVGFELGESALAGYQATGADVARLWAELGYKVFGIDGRLLSAEQF